LAARFLGISQSQRLNYLGSLSARRETLHPPRERAATGSTATGFDLLGAGIM